MTREQAKAMLPIIQGFADGKTVQFNHGGWYDLNDLEIGPGYNWPPERFRIKPEPREFWIAQPKDRPPVVFFSMVTDNAYEEVIHVKEVQK